MERVNPICYSAHYEILLSNPIELTELIPDSGELNADTCKYLERFTLLWKNEMDEDQKKVYEQCRWILKRAIDCGGHIEHIKIAQRCCTCEYFVSFDIVFNDIKQVVDF